MPFGGWLAFGLASLILLGTAHIGRQRAVRLRCDRDNRRWQRHPAIDHPQRIELLFLMAMTGAFRGLAELGLVGLFVGPVVITALLLVWRQWMSTGSLPVVASSTG